MKKIAIITALLVALLVFVPRTALAQETATPTPTATETQLPTSTPYPTQTPYPTPDNIHTFSLSSGKVAEVAIHADAGQILIAGLLFAQVILTFVQVAQRGNDDQ